MPDRDTIYALSTAPGKAGIAVIRVSGPQACAVVETLAPPLPDPRVAAFRKIREPDGEVVDSGLVLWFAAPRTETGEDMAEFHLHGSRAVVSALLDLLGSRPGLRPAEAGEFARRAFDNGKLDLIAVEGLADLIEAETAAQRRQALRQLDGQLGRKYGAWRERLIRSLALLEAGIDFVDEDDVPEGLWRQTLPELVKLAEEMAQSLKDDGRGESIRQGAVLVVAGPPNAGKSSLLNALARRDVAIVSGLPGTTRDAIEVRLDLGGIAVTAVDTAGLREAHDAIEAEGVRRAERHIANADLVLWLFDATDEGSTPHPPEVDAPVWRVANKCDLLERQSGGVADVDHAISVSDGIGMDGLVRALTRHFRNRFESGTEPVITRQRHRRELELAKGAIGRALAEDYVTAPDLVAEELRVAATALGRIAGRIDVEDLLDVIFSEFCVGK
jgi:tRNA modification GTPase